MAINMVAIKSPDDAERSRLLTHGMQEASARIPGTYLFIVAMNSIKKDFKYKFDTRGKRGNEDGLYEIKPSATRHKTVFDYNWNVVWMDEIHEIRNAGDKHNAMLSLFRKGTFNGGMSATPLTTKLEDIPMIGRAVGFEWLRFRRGSQFIQSLRVEMTRQRAETAAYRTAAWDKQKESLARGIQLAIESIPEFRAAKDSTMRGLVVARLKSLLVDIEPHFIRRHKGSLLPNREPILRLPPLHIMRHLIPMAEHERDTATIETGHVKKLLDACGGLGTDPYVRPTGPDLIASLTLLPFPCQVFLTGVRRFLIHTTWAYKTMGARGNKRSEMVKKAQSKITLPRSVQDDPSPSSKLIAAVKLVEDLLREDQDKVGRDHRKILVYCHWSNMHDVVQRVSFFTRISVELLIRATARHQYFASANIPVMVINGFMNAETRDHHIVAFNAEHEHAATDNRKSWVAIISDTVSVGTNVARASELVLLVSVLSFLGFISVYPLPHEGQ